MIIKCQIAKQHSFPLPEQIEEGREDTIIKENFELINGEMPTEKEDILLLINTKNQLNSTILKAIGFDNVDSINFDEIVGKEFKLILNDNLYKNNGEILYNKYRLRRNV